MASTSASMEMNVEQPQEADGQFIRVIVADTQAIFRAGLRKIFALEDDIRVVGQSESLSQTLSAAKKFSADILIFEAALTQNPVDAISDLMRQTPGLRLVVVTQEPIRNLPSNCCAAVCTELFPAMSSPNFWWSACAKSPKATPGWTAAARSGCSKPIAPRDRVPPHPGPRCS